jgi:hypothetical protein
MAFSTNTRITREESPPLRPEPKPITRAELLKVNIPSGEPEESVIAEANYRAFPYCYFTDHEKQKAKIPTSGDWVPRSMKCAELTLPGSKPPIGVGLFSRKINDMKVSVVKPLADKNSTITKFRFIQNEGWLRRKKEYAKKYAKEFARDWLNKGIDGKKAKPNEDKIVMDGEEDDDRLPDYLKKAKIIIFDPAEQVKKWRDTGE